MNWIDKDKDSIWHPFTPLIGSAEPLPVKKAAGVYLELEDGRKIIDAISSWWVNLHGHSHPRIAQAIAEQAATLEHVIFAGFSHEPAVKLAENLLSILPDNQDKVFYSDDGSTACEVAMKMAFQFWYNKGEKRNKIIAIDGAYHGDTFGSMSVGDRGPFTDPFTPFLFDVEFLKFPTKELEDEVETRFDKLMARDDIAAFIFEPIVQGASGMQVYSTALLDRIIAKAQAKGVICIADEVMTGFGRLGKLFAADFLVNKPDIMCLSKGLTGGAMAMGVTTCTSKIIDAYRSGDIMKTFFHGHSFTANPMACAAANASFELLMSTETEGHLKRINQQHTRFSDRIADHAQVANLRVIGTILAFELSSFGETSYVNEARHKLYPYFLERNILLRPLGNVIYIIPPYIIDNDQLRYIYDTIYQFLEELD
ncbi:MAG: adenosylmethionine--8-amino-7-oxononanoate transaminase [Bacteroidota bacterium]